MNGLITLWIQNVTALLGNGERLEVRLSWRSLGMYLWVAPSLLPVYHDVNFSVPPHLHHHDILNPLKPQGKINPYSFKLFILVTVTQKLD
jgi:hypothetical protein